MKEMQFLNAINNILSNSSFLGDDCAYLPEFGIFVTQDTLCEGIHFDLKLTDLYKLAKKTVAVNLSDLASALAEPGYISVSISAPKTFAVADMENFYKGIEAGCKKYNIAVCGGDITGSKSGLVISVCAFGKKVPGTPKTSRSFAKPGQVVCVTKNYGSSAYSLYCLQNGLKCSEELLNEHLEPIPDIEVSKDLSKLKCEKIAVMDSSDGLCDALYKISEASGVSIDVDFEKIPYDKEIENYSDGFKDLILWGGEDYGLVFTVSEKDYEMLNSQNKKITKIGNVLAKQKDYFVKFDEYKIDREIFLKKSFNHFKGEKNE